MLTGILLSGSLAALASFKFVKRKNQEIRESFDYCTDEYRKALDDYKSNGKQALNKYREAI